MHILPTIRNAVRCGAITVLMLAALAAPAHATNIERVVSPGGIEIWLVRNSIVPLVAVNFAILGGSSQDPADKAGLAEMTIGTLDEGAGDLDSTAFQGRLERKAIELQLRATRDYVRGTLRTLTEHQDEAFELLGLALTAPRFDATAVERVRAQMISRLQRQSTRPNDVAGLKWWAAAFPGHPYGRPGNGTLESVPRITADDMRGYVRRVLARDTLKVAVVGDIDAAAAGKLVDRTFGSLPAKAELTPIPHAAIQGLGSRIVADLDVPQASVMFGGRGVPRSEPDFMAAYIVNHILGGGSFNSRLYREVREKRGLAYGVSTSLVWLRHAAVTIGTTATRSDETAQSIDVIETEVQRIAREGPTAEEVEKAKAYLKGSFALSLDTSSKIASQLVQMQTDNLGIDYIERRSAMIDAVTLEDTRRAAKRMLESGLLVSIAGRPKGIKSRTPGG